MKNWKHGKTDLVRPDLGQIMLSPAYEASLDPVITAFWLIGRNDRRGSFRISLTSSPSGGPSRRLEALAHGLGKTGAGGFLNARLLAGLTSGRIARRNCAARLTAATAIFYRLGFDAGIRFKSGDHLNGQFVLDQFLNGCE
jgi:hypothetical protein